MSAQRVSIWEKKVMTIKTIQLSINNMDVLMCITSACDISFMKPLSPNFLKFLSPAIIYDKFMRLKMDIQRLCLFNYDNMARTNWATLYILPYTETKPFHRFISISLMWECNESLKQISQQKINIAFIYKPIPNKIKVFFLYKWFIQCDCSIFIILKF